MRQTLRRLWFVIRHRQLDDQLAEELEFHRAMKQRDMEAGGLDTTDAAFAARRAFGSGALAHDQARDAWVPRWLQGVAQDFRLASRVLMSARLVSAVAILSLALGIGANTAIFSLVNSLLLRQLPVRDPGRLALLVEPARPGAADNFGGVPSRLRYAVWDQIVRRPQLFDGAIAWSSTAFHLGAGTDTEPIDGVWASDAFFDVLGVPPVIGRTFSAADNPILSDGGGGEPVAVISYSFWQRHFGGAADALGRSIRVDAVPFTVVGVTPPEFFGPEIGRRFDVIVPLWAEPRVHGRESWIAPTSLSSPLTVMARLKTDQTAESASAALRGVQPHIRSATVPESYPEPFRSQWLKDPLTLMSVSAASTSIRRQYGRPLLTIMAVVALVLLIACGNVANLLLARATARRHELSVRRALGASRWRLVRQLLAESALLAAVASTLGLLVASWASRVLVRQLSTDASPIFLDLSMNARVVVFTVGVAVTTVLLFGVLPAFRASGIAPSDALKTHTATTDTRAGVANGLVVAQVALSVVLVATSVLLVRTFVSLTNRQLGFDPNRLLVVNLSAQPTAIDPNQRVTIYERVRDAVAHLPGVAAASLGSNTPIVTGPMLGQPIKAVSGGTPLPPRGGLSALNLVSDGWFGTLTIPIISGRDFSERDRERMPPVAIVNQAFARRFLNGANPVGHTANLFLPGPPPPPVEIVGLVADSVYGTLRSPEPATIYLPLAQLSEVASPFLASVNLTVRASRGSPALLITSVAAAIGGVSSGLTLTFHTLNDQLDASLAQERVLAMLSGFFGGVALLLAALGLYGVTAYAVARRRMEIGIRMALGATAGIIVRTVLVRVAVLVGTGVAIGALVSLWTSRFVAALLYGLQPRDPATLVGAAAVLAAVAAIAAWLPAWRAARVDPAIALRYE